MSKQDTNVSKVEVDLDAFFPGLDVQEVKTGGDNNMFGQSKSDNFLDRLDPAEDETEDKDEGEDNKTPDNKNIPPVSKAPKTDPKAADKSNKILDELDTNLDQKEFEEAKSGSNWGLKEFIKEKVESGDLVLFEDYDEKTMTVEEYLSNFTKEDYSELWKANKELKENEISERVPQEFFNMLPPELQKAAQYAVDGGTDLKGFLQSLLETEYVKELNPATDAEGIARQYLTLTEFGTEEEIQEQINEWKDLKKLDERAKMFHPKLVKIQEKETEEKVVKQQQELAKKQEKYNFFHSNVVETLKKGEIDGMKLTPDQQNKLYQGLTKPTFTSADGRPVTAFNYKIEEAMWVNPNYNKLAKIQWLLEDEEGFEKAIALKHVNKNTEKTVRLLKTEQGSKSTSTTVDKGDEDKSVPKKLIPRDNSKIFRR